LRRRDFAKTDDPDFYLVEGTRTERRELPGGKVVTRSTTESDLTAGGATRNIQSQRPEVVEERIRQDVVKEDGTRAMVVSVKRSSAVEPRLRPSYEVVQQTDRQGNVRQIFTPVV